jgi:hypothetical protein
MIMAIINTFFKTLSNLDDNVYLKALLYQYSLACPKKSFSHLEQILTLQPVTYALKALIIDNPRRG